MNQLTAVSPFHRGERDVQTRVGVRDSSEYLGQRMISNSLPREHKEFLSQLPFVLIGSVDAFGRPWASVLVGRPGFIDAPDANTITINARRVFGDPLEELLTEGADVGLLGIEYRSRRRNRVATKVAAVSDDVITLSVVQAFGNCPQYIQARDYELLAGIDTIGEPLTKYELDGLDDRAKEIIASADNFYIASHYSEGASDKSHGADVSHRGGKPGFVQIEGDNTLIFPDFYGNNMFNTIGNINVNPRAGLLFIDFENGDLLYLTCAAEIIWDSEETRAFVGAERTVRLTVEQGLLVEKAVPIRWAFRDYSPSLASTGSWREVSEKMSTLTNGNEYRDYQVQRLERESDTITSFYLAPADSERIPCHVAGQFLPIEIQPLDTKAPIRRTYTISSAPNGTTYRLSIKREPSAGEGFPAGVSSSYFHDLVEKGTVIRALSPRGKFVLDESSARPVVLISGGVGITPMISMLEQLASDDGSCGCARPVWFIHGAVNSEVHSFSEKVGKLADALPCLKTHIRYSKPTDKDVASRNHDSVGHIDRDLIKSLLPLDDYDFYLCGPSAFMESVYTDLKGSDVADERIHYEFFGPGASLGTQLRNESLIGELGDQQPVAVHFARSGIETTWDPSRGTLLDLAESEGLQPAYSCRSGVCQTCATQITEGDVGYLESPMADPGERTALICCAYPRGKSDLDGSEEPLILDL